MPNDIGKALLIGLSSFVQAGVPTFINTRERKKMEAIEAETTEFNKNITMAHLDLAKKKFDLNLMLGLNRMDRERDMIEMDKLQNEMRFLKDALSESGSSKKDEIAKEKLELEKDKFWLGTLYDEYSKYESNYDKQAADITTSINLRPKISIQEFYNSKIVPMAGVVGYELPEIPVPGKTDVYTKQYGKGKGPVAPVKSPNLLGMAKSPEKPKQEFDSIDFSFPDGSKKTAKTADEAYSY